METAQILPEVVESRKYLDREIPPIEEIYRLDGIKLVEILNKLRLTKQAGMYLRKNGIEIIGEFRTSDNVFRTSTSIGMLIDGSHLGRKKDHEICGELYLVTLDYSKDSGVKNMHINLNLVDLLREYIS